MTSRELNELTPFDSSRLQRTSRRATKPFFSTMFRITSCLEIHADWSCWRDAEREDGMNSTYVCVYEAVTK